MSTSRIPVGRSELEKAFIKHYLVGKGNNGNPSHILLLFYAVECGLKSVYPKREKLSTTAQIKEECLTKDGHNLMAWSKAIKLPANIPGDKTINFRLLKNGGRYSDQWPMSKAHQAWRYGALINNDDEKELVEWLNKVYKHLEEYEIDTKRYSSL